MINYIEKGHGLHEAIGDAGHKLWHEDRVWRSTNDAVVQSIIDNYDYVPYEREKALERVSEQFEKAALAVDGMYPMTEQRSFYKQEREAKAFTRDNASPTPLLSRMAAKRGRTVANLAAKVLLNSSNSENAIGDLIGTRHKREAAIGAATDLQALLDIKLEG